MTQTANMCKELITQGLENLIQKEFREQDTKYESTVKEIREFLYKMCVVEPIATILIEEEMFRLTHIIRKETESSTSKVLDLTKLNKYKTGVFLDTEGYYNVFVDKNPMSYKTYTCPPPAFDIIGYMWDSVYGTTNPCWRMFDKFLKTIEKEIFIE